MRDLAERRGIGRLEFVGSGLEFAVYRGLDRDGRPVALRVAHRRFDSNANDPGVDTRALLVQEHRITRHLSAHGFPVAEPVELVLAERPSSRDVLISRYLPDDGSPLDGYALGRLLARLHELPPPRLRPVASEGMPTRGVLAARIRRRWAEVGRRVTGWPEAPSRAVLDRVLAGTTGRSLLHLDVRSANLRRRHGRPTGLLDWSNTLIGDAVVEFARLAEYARYTENDLDLPALRAGYASVRAAPPPEGPATLAGRLDTALMLALVFLSEAPDPSRGPAAAEHARELGARVSAC
ncbi:phosphotransferase enzyme family protein [Nonomuraea sp. NPDC002799]